jgi:hypothetical protein
MNEALKTTVRLEEIMKSNCEFGEGLMASTLNTYLKS